MNEYGIAILVLFFVEVLSGLYMHGKKKTGRYNSLHYVLWYGTLTALMFLAGTFN